MAVCVRLKHAGYSKRVLSARQRKTTSRTTARLPVTDDHDAGAAIQLAGANFHQAAAAAAAEVEGSELA